MLPFTLRYFIVLLSLNALLPFFPEVPLYRLGYVENYTIRQGFDSVVSHNLRN